MRDSSVGSKGQVTIPVEFRKQLGIDPNDRVVFTLEGDTLKVQTLRSRLGAIHQSVPAPDPLRTWDEVTAIAQRKQILGRQ